MAEEKKGDEKKEPNYLLAAIRGLEFRTAQKQESKAEGGGKKITHVPIVRPMTVDDVLSHRREGAKVALTARDGSKYTVDLGRGKEE